MHDTVLLMDHFSELLCSHWYVGIEPIILLHYTYQILRLLLVFEFVDILSMSCIIDLILI